MTRDTQYPQQAFIDPETLGEPEAVKLEEFWQPFSEPVRQLRGVAFAAALIASSGMAPIDPEALGEGEAPAVDVSTEWHQPFSEPVLLSQGVTYRATLAASGAVVIDPEALNEPLADRIEWLPQFSEPVLEPLDRAAAAALSAGFVSIDPEALGEPLADRAEWFSVFSEPILELPGSKSTAALAAGIAPIDPEALGQGEAPPADESTEWIPPLSGPVLRPVSALYAEAGFVSIDPEALSEPLADRLEWYAALSEPVLPISRYQHPAVFDDQEAIGGEGVPPDTSTEWWQAFSEPVPPIAGLEVANQQAFVIDPEALGVPQTPIIEQWWEDFSQPVQVDPNLAYAAAQAASGFIPIDPETLAELEDTVLSWFVPFSEPLPLPLSFGELVYVEHIEPAAPDTGTEWWQSFSEPTPPAAGLHVSNQQAFFIDPVALDAPEPTGFLDWFVPFSEPVLPISRFQHTFDFHDPEALGAVGVTFFADSRITTFAVPDRTFTVAAADRTFTPADD